MIEKTCVRYFIDETLGNMLEIYKEAELRESRMMDEEISLRRGDVSISSRAPVLIKSESSLQAYTMCWGFWSKEGKKRNEKPKLYPNTALETAYQSNLWRLAIENRRCIVPTNGFYLWKESQNARHKKLFRMPDSDMLYIAGIYSLGGERAYFYSLVTIESNSSTISWRPRMPLVLRPSEFDTWLSGDYKSLGDRENLILKPDRL